MHRVRTLLRYIECEYTPLKKAGVVPNLPFFNKVKKVGTTIPFPKAMYKTLGPSEFGLFMEKIIECALMEKDLPLEYALSEIGRMFPNLPFNVKEYTDVGNLVRDHVFPLLAGGASLAFQEEWSSEGIQGHPDVVCGDCVYDIKTSGRFGRMRVSCIFQLLSYFCLAQKSNLPIKKIGLILPMQNMVVTYDLEKWKWEGYWARLKECIAKKTVRENLYRAPFSDLQAFEALRTRYVGTHIGKAELFKAMGYERPLQFFVGGRCNSNVEVTSAFRKRLKKEVDKTGVSVFIHSPYTLNLSNDEKDLRKVLKNKKREKELANVASSSTDTSPISRTCETWVCEKLRYLLKLGDECGLKGIVVHVGKVGKREKTIALQNMYTNVCDVGQFASEKCPLLIETPAGENGELLCTPVEFANFWISLPPNIQKNVAVCVDTCHVFSSGYDPCYYIGVLAEYNVPVKLFHYNDSLREKGACVDRHAGIGDGWIGFEELSGVLLYASGQNVPCVYE